VARIRLVPSGKLLHEVPLPSGEGADNVQFACTSQRFRVRALSATGLLLARNCGPSDEVLLEPSNGKVLWAKRRTPADRASDASEFVRLCGRAGFSGCAQSSEALSRAGRPFWFGEGATLALVPDARAGLVVLSRSDATQKLVLAESRAQALGVPLAISPTHDRLLGVDGTGTLRLWDLATGKVLVSRSVKP
jgi:hypothetical protein